MKSLHQMAVDGLGEWRRARRCIIHYFVKPRSKSIHARPESRICTNLHMKPTRNHEETDGLRMAIDDKCSTLPGLVWMIF